MQLQLDAEQNRDRQVDLSRVETYVDFRTQLPKPSKEDAHLRHILRFYTARSFAKGGYEHVYVLPAVSLDGQPVELDVVATADGKRTMLAVCEPDSVTPETLEKLSRLTDVPEAGVVIIYSRYGKDRGVVEAFKPQFDAKQFRLVAVVPPPFDDVYEYDIWMFETTFRNVLED